MKWPTHTPADVKLPSVLEQWRRTSMDGRGANSQHSPSMADGGTRQVLKPVVLSIFVGSGLRRFLTTLAGISALKEEATGEHMVTVSWGMELAVLKSLIEESENAGNSEEIRCELSIASEGPATTSPNIWSSSQMSGISGARCDFCAKAFQKDQSYTTICSPSLQSLHLYHSACVKVTIIE